MQVGVCTISAKSQSVESILDRCGDLPVDGVEIWGEDHVGDGSPERCREIAAAAEANGLAIPVYGSYLRPGTGTFDEDVDRELAIADRLGADVIRVWAGEQEYEDCEPAHWDRVVADLERLGTAAGERGLAVTVERHSGSVTNATAGARELIEQVDAPAVGLNWQPLFEHDAGTVVADARELAPLANNVHVQAVPAPGEHDRCALADAYFDVAAVVEAFEETGFDGFLEIEFVTEAAPYGAALAADVAFLRALV
jgi:sugar phosphate isomerase/epimerase